MINPFFAAPTWHALQSVSICDERPTARLVVSRIISEAVTDGAVISVSTDPAELLTNYAARPTDLVVVGVRAERIGGVQAVTQLLDIYPDAAVIVYGSVQDADAMSVAIRQGAKGLMVWDANNPIVTPARQTSTRLAVGQTYSGAVRSMAKLTDRELQILCGMSNGLSNGEIGRTLFLSEDTVKTHARSMFHKLGARDRAHAVALELRGDLVA